MKKRLPKISKNVKKSLTKLEKTKKVLIGGAFAAGLVAAGGFPVDSHAKTSNGTHNTASTGLGEALLMHPSTSDNIVADHESHWSHSSHGSHSSHYSSRY